MAYIGKQPTVGNFVKLDAITTSATTTFNLLNGGVAYFPQSPNHCLVSLNGILQAPTDSFTISGSTIIFSSALTTSDVIDFIIVLGDVLNIGTPSDNTVSLAKLTATGTKDATTFLRGDNTFATAGATAGTIIQVVQTYKTDTFQTTSSTLTDITGLSASITPASSSNKVLVMVHIGGAARASAGGNLRLLRGSTQIGVANTASNRSLSSFSGNMWITSDHDASRAMVGNYLDSPATTSSTTYKIQGKNGTGAALNINRTNNDTDSEDSPGRMTSSITLMEIKG